MDPISLISGLATSIISRIWPDKTEAEKQKFLIALQTELNNTELNKKLIDADLAQTEVNAEEAKSSNLFVSGARPFIMWGLGGVLVIYFTLSTITAFAVALQFHVVPMPSLDPMIRDIVLGLLGLGWIARSYDKKVSSGK